MVKMLVVLADYLFEEHSNDKDSTLGSGRYVKHHLNSMVDDTSTSNIQDIEQESRPVTQNGLWLKSWSYDDKCTKVQRLGIHKSISVSFKFLGINLIMIIFRDHGLAEELFKSLSHQGSPAYCALIRGMTRYYQVGLHGEFCLFLAYSVSL